jgi:hypothetical protein
MRLDEIRHLVELCVFERERALSVDRGKSRDLPEPRFLKPCVAFECGLTEPRLSGERRALDRASPLNVASPNRAYPLNVALSNPASPLNVALPNRASPPKVARENSAFSGPVNCVSWNSAVVLNVAPSKFANRIIVAPKKSQYR